MSEQNTSPTPKPSGEQAEKSIIRFDLSQRIEHFILLVSFTILGITGLPQKYPTQPASDFVLRLFGGIETARAIHHVSAIVLMIVSVYHVIAVAYRIIVLRSPLTMLPLLDDFKHLFQDIGYYLGLRKHKGYYARFNYAEKVEYLAVVWGTLVMAITGFMMWNPIATANYLPGQWIPAAKAAHGGEAVLAVLSILVWHFYHVHLKKFNKSMFTGRLTREEMEHEHPAELAQIESGNTIVNPEPAILRKRQQIFAPFAAGFALVLSFGIFSFVTFEQTAIQTIDRGENVAIFVPLTPTPRPTATLLPTPKPGEGVGANTWLGQYEALFRNRCGTCHGITSVGGLSLATLEQALAGGKSGPAIVPGNPEDSVLVQVQQAGGHPGQLSSDELARVIEWINQGAPER
jgi:cytochrome b subunit of formate dehydrogenase